MAYAIDISFDVEYIRAMPPLPFHAAAVYFHYAAAACFMMPRGGAARCRVQRAQHITDAISKIMLLLMISDFLPLTIAMMPYAV